MQSDGSKLSLSPEQRQSSRSIRQSLTSLIDAMRSADRKGELEGKIDDIQAGSKKSAESLDSLNQKIDSLIKSIGDTTDADALNELSLQVTGFSKLAIEQTKSKLSEKTISKLRENRAALDTEITKTRKSIEAFVATAPFQVLEKLINVRLIDGAYEARGIYRCAEGVTYEFNYDSKKSRIFGKQVRLSAFDKDYRIPISLGKTWLRKDQVPDYERIDQYSLESAESSETSLIVIFKHEEKDARLKVICSKHDSHSSLSLEYLDVQRVVDITGTPSLNRFLESDPLENTMERLWLAITDLQNYKAGLSKLIFDDRNILEKLDCLAFFEKAWNTIMPKIVQEIKGSSSQNGSGFRDDSLTEEFVTEKIRLLGPKADLLLESLGIGDATV